MYDSHEAIDHRLNFSKDRDDVDARIVATLQEMIDHNDLLNDRDIIAEDKRFGLKHISDLHPCFISLQYPLLFPFGEDGFRTNIKHRNISSSEDRRKSTVSQREYYSFRLQYRIGEGRTLILGGRLLLQFIVDACFRRGDIDAIYVGKRVILPSNFTKGYRYMQQNFQDSLAVCKEYGHPNLFITFTCNPKWVEIQGAVNLASSQAASVRPDIVARVFKMKLDVMIDDFTKNNVLGQVLKEDIDTVICAELPDKNVDHFAYKAVSQFMMHGPCREANPKCPTAEASWRILEFPIHHREPFVQRLYFHLESEQEVRFRDNETLLEIVCQVDPDGIMFIQWLMNNRCEELGRDLTFVKYPLNFGGMHQLSLDFLRKKIDVIGRMVYAHPAAGERYYLRLLLNFVVGPKSFEEIRTVDGVVYPTYKEAYFHRGLLESDKEWHVALGDASLCANVAQLRDSFVTLLVFCEIRLWGKYWTALADDIEYKRRKIYNNPTLTINTGDKQMLALEEHNNLLKQYGKKNSDYQGLPELNTATTSKYRNELLVEEMMYDRERLRLKVTTNLDRLNQMQHTVF
ncbi:uncharacterized protein LOC141679760 [Apium graveolens]|uniref:uncharacterized protein LOC141679760 n=1 Tax=Apium graveolens TaxID=4045 RepID=UPI003D7ADDCA